MNNKKENGISNNRQRKEVITFAVPFSLNVFSVNNSTSTNANIQRSQEQIINQAFQFHSQGNIKEAAKYYQSFINKGLKDYRVFSNYGVILRDLKYLQEAEIYTRKAIECKPNIAEAHFNLANILKDIGNFQEAEISIRKAIELKPGYANAYLTLGNTLNALGNLEEAESSLLKALELKSDFADASAVLGTVLLQKGENDTALKYFSKSSELLRGQSKTELTSKKFTETSLVKIEHDIEQFEYLASQDHMTKKFVDLANLYKKVNAEISWPSETQIISLSNTHQSLLQGSYNLLVHRAQAPRLKKGAVNNSLNVDKITNDYFDHDFGLTYIDDFLSPEAANSLRKFLLESTIWFDIKKDGYLGAYLTEGLANPLLLQIAEELRKKFPKIFRDFPVNQIWAYKYDSRAKKQNSSLRGINVHADFAAVNVNFWITPSNANLNANSGGLVVYDVEAPKDWDFNTYNNDEKKIREELKKSRGHTKIIPYKGNRAVVFNSNLFHETDSYEFKEGYENRRINVTMLFGNRD